MVLHLRHDSHRLLHPGDASQRHQIGMDAASDTAGAPNDTAGASTSAPPPPSAEIPEGVNATVGIEDDALRPYAIASVSVMLLFCLVTLVFNAIILASAFWIRRPMSPTLSLSISLAAADAYNSLFLGTGLFVNSFLPRVFGISVESMAHGTCVMLGFEAMRVGGILVSVAHLLALAINHYLGILRPLHYAATLTPRITSILTVALWVLPITFFFVYFSSIEKQGFQSTECDYGFLKLLGFRAVFSFLFFVPLALMAAIYLHIYCIVRRTQCSRQRSRLGRHCDEGSRGLVRACSRDNRSTVTTEGSGGNRGCTPRSRQLARNWKAVVTTMLILGTYLVGWIPAVLLFLLICDNCLLNFKDNDPRVLLVAYSLANLLIILKSLSNPIIYAARMQEIKTALGRMKETVLGIPAPRPGTTTAASAAESTHGFGRPRGGGGSQRRPGGCYCCYCCSAYDSELGFYGSDISRNRLSTYASTASGGNATAMTTNSVFLFRIKSMQKNPLNGTTSKSKEPEEEQDAVPLQRSSTRSHQRRREEVRNQMTGI